MPKQRLADGLSVDHAQRVRAPTSRSRYGEFVVESFADALEQAKPGHDDEDDVRAAVYAAMGVAPRPRVIRLGRYRVGEPLGQGGAGAVYQGTDEELGRQVAIKLVRARPVGHEDDDAAQRRLLREARAVARLAHPHVISVYDVGRYDADDLGALEGMVASEGVYVVMELVSGPNLGDWLRSSRPLPEVLEVMHAAGRGLAAAHAAGLVHRDFKPGNVLVGEDRVRVADFGLARVAREPTPHVATDLHSAEPSLAVTKVGAIAGTFPYMAPEQYSGQHGAAADQYAFCITAYEALAGRRPFPDEPQAALAAKHAGHVPTATAIPAAVHAVLARGLQPRPEDRHRSMNALLAELRPRRRLRRLLVPGLLTASTVAAVVLVSRGLAPCGGGTNPAPAALERAATGAPTMVAERLRDEAAALRTAWQQACQAPVRNAEHTECLAQRAEERTKLVELVDAGVLDGALVVDALAKLPAPGDCTAVPSSATGATPPPRDAVAVRRLRARLRNAGALAQLGLTREAEIEVEAVRTAAEVLGFVPLSVATKATTGFVQLSRRDIEQARETLESAYWEAHEIDDVATMAVTSRELAFIYGRHRSDFSAAHTWERHADAALERNGSPAWEVAGLRNVQAANRMAAGDPQTGVELFRSAIDHLEASTGHRAEELAVAYTNLGEALSKTGEQQAAEDALEQASTLRRNLHGEDHVSQTPNLVHLAKVRDRQQRLAESIELLHRARALVEQADPTGHPWRPVLLQNLGAMLGREGRFEEAIESFTAATEQLECDRESSNRCAGLHKNIGLAYEKLTRPDDAARHYKSALAGFASGHPLRAEALIQVASFELSRGDRALASALAQQAQAEVDGMSPPRAGIAASLAELRQELDMPLVGPMPEPAEGQPDDSQRDG